MSNTTNIRKGSRIRAQWWNTRPVCLAGVQPKVEGTPVTVTGIVRHVRGDHPINPTIVRFYVDPEGDCTEPRVQAYGCTCPGGHVEVNPVHVIDDEGRGVVEATPIPS